MAEYAWHIVILHENHDCAFLGDLTGLLDTGLQDLQHLQKTQLCLLGAKYMFAINTVHISIVFKR